MAHLGEDGKSQHLLCVLCVTVCVQEREGGGGGGQREREREECVCRERGVCVCVDMCAPSLPLGTFDT